MGYDSLKVSGYTNNSGEDEMKQVHQQNTGYVLLLVPYVLNRNYLVIDVSQPPECDKVRRRSWHATSASARHRLMIATLLGSTEGHVKLSITTFHVTPKSHRP